MPAGGAQELKRGSQEATKQTQVHLLSQSFAKGSLITGQNLGRQDINWKSELSQVTIEDGEGRFPECLKMIYILKDPNHNTTKLKCIYTQQMCSTVSNFQQEGNSHDNIKCLNSASYWLSNLEPITSMLSFSYSLPSG